MLLYSDPCSDHRGVGGLSVPSVSTKPFGALLKRPAVVSVYRHLALNPNGVLYLANDCS